MLNENKQHLTGTDLRQDFRSFFESRNYYFRNSFPLLPENDPSVLFTNASITPFKPHLTSELPKLSQDIALIQGCIRVGSNLELTSVGNDPNILTFFYMLGLSVQNKELKQVTQDVIDFLLTKRYFLQSQLWATVHEQDDESLKALSRAGLSKNRIKFMSQNSDIWVYWHFGIPGPGGFGSTIIIDLGEQIGCLKETCDIFCQCGRFQQLLNIIHIDNFHTVDGVKTKLDQPGIDVGCGLERLLALSNKCTSFECDPLREIIHETETLLSQKYNFTKTIDRRLRIIADHSRSISFLISGGILPGNKLHSYIVRKLIRRAVTQGYLLGFHTPFFANLIEKIITKKLVEINSPNVLNIVRAVVIEEMHTIKLLSRSKSLIKKRLSRIKLLDAQSRLVLIDELWTTYGIPKEISQNML